MGRGGLPQPIFFFFCNCSFQSIPVRLLYCIQKRWKKSLKGLRGENLASTKKVDFFTPSLRQQQRLCVVGYTTTSTLQFDIFYVFSMSFLSLVYVLSMSYQYLVYVLSVSCLCLVYVLSMSCLCLVHVLSLSLSLSCLNLVLSKSSLCLVFVSA